MPSSIQSELTLFATEESLSKVAESISRILLHSNAWLNASEILDRLAQPDTESNRRHVRLCAEQLGDELISGQKGYKHIDRATDAEVIHFARWMLAQAGKMSTRAHAALARKGIKL